jgi:hypothetical protein
VVELSGDEEEVKRKLACSEVGSNALEREVGSMTE